MKNLFLALALTAFAGSTVVNTVAAATGTVITASCDCEKCKKDHKDKKCKDGSTCCKSKTSTTTENKCSKEGNKSCCSHAKTASTTPATAPVKTDSKEKETK